MKRVIPVTCIYEGCNESARYSYDSVAEAKRDYERRRTWKCLRHSSPEKVVGLDNKVTVVEYTVTELFSDMRPDTSIGLYWVANGDKSGSGFTHGPGFRAYANDFPIGTKLIVKSELILPEK